MFAKQTNISNILPFREPKAKSGVSYEEIEQALK